MLTVIIVLQCCSTGGMKAVVWTDVFQLVGHHWVNTNIIIAVMTIGYC